MELDNSPMSKSGMRIKERCLNLLSTEFQASDECWNLYTAWKLCKFCIQVRDQSRMPELAVFWSPGLWRVPKLFCNLTIVQYSRARWGSKQNVWTCYCLKSRREEITKNRSWKSFNLWEQGGAQGRSIVGTWCWCSPNSRLEIQKCFAIWKRDGSWMCSGVWKCSGTQIRLVFESDVEIEEGCLNLMSVLTKVQAWDKFWECCTTWKQYGTCKCCWTWKYHRILKSINICFWDRDWRRMTELDANSV